MRPTEHDLNSLRNIIRNLQDENSNLKKLLDENNISYSADNVIDTVDISDEYDDDQAGRIIHTTPDLDMAKEFYSYFWGRTDVYAVRGKVGGYFPRCKVWWNNPSCPKKADKKKFCDEDCIYKEWDELVPWKILNHLKGQRDDCTDVIGVYPLFSNNTCRFLVYDPRHVEIRWKFSDEVLKLLQI